MIHQQDSAHYRDKKAFFRQILTIYGRKPVDEALADPTLQCFRLHLAISNKPSNAIKTFESIAQQRNIDVHYHDRQALSRISKNGKQDQGVCLDIYCPQHQDYQHFLTNHIKRQENPSPKYNNKLRLLALDRITNPQNVGMIIRSACAGHIDGILLADKGSAKLDALVIKASAGTLFKAPIIKCATLEEALKNFQHAGIQLVGLSGQASLALTGYREDHSVVYILGNETEGISNVISELCDQQVFIPMRNEVESLNVAVTASLLAFRYHL